MTYAEVREHGMARKRGGDHRSHSQLTEFKACGIRYALSDLDAIPAWWNVAGTAFHYAAEAINRQAERDNAVNINPGMLWQACLGRAVTETAVETGTNPTTWRAAKKGAEGYDWWRVEGVGMVQRWATKLTALLNAGWQIAIDNSEGSGAARSMVEYPVSIKVDPFPDGIAPVKVDGIIDLVMWNATTGEYRIVDFKSGGSAPDSADQLAEYAHAVRVLVGQDAIVSGAYYLTRDDDFDLYTDAQLRELRPLDAMGHEYWAMDTTEKQGLYLPGKTPKDTFGCNSCPVKHLCPAGPR
jgi:hypothetical protein